MTRNVLWSPMSVCLYACLSVCVSVRGRMPTLLHGPDVTWGVVGDAASCTLLAGFAIATGCIAMAI